MELNMKLFALIIVGICSILVDKTLGHGMMLSPPGRSSRWRYDISAVINYDDNANFCGGYNVHWNTNAGKCGLCGDNFADPEPRANELGGKYGGNGVIVQTYKDTSAVTIGFDITANHLGYVSFDLCDLGEFTAESEECFAKYGLKFVDGSDKFYIDTTRGWIDTTVVLPIGLSCKHCVLRWTYTAGNNWGICQNGKGEKGCGPQETFKSCADIRIVAPKKQQKLMN